MLVRLQTCAQFARQAVHNKYALMGLDLDSFPHIAYLLRSIRVMGFLILGLHTLKLGP
jgi:hypothetical protein